MKNKSRSFFACIILLLLVVLVACNKAETDHEASNVLSEAEQEGEVKDEPKAGQDTQPVNFEESVRSSTTLVAEKTELIMSMPFPEGRGLNAVQGGCYDGKYWYQAFINTATNQDENEVTIVKVDMATQEIVQMADKLTLHHANDLTYNSKLGYLVLSNGAPHRELLTYLDPEDLHVIKTFPIDYEIFSISYNETTNQYMVGLADGQSFCILDSDFNRVSPIFEPTTRTIGHVTQGATSDENYIYFVLYQTNVIAIYDWEGNFVSLVDLDISDGCETEWISIVDERFYIGCAGAGAELYEVEGLVPKE